MMRPALFHHQTVTANFVRENERCLVFNDPGTGKTASVLEAYRQELKQDPTTGRMLVLAPKAILRSAWCADCMRFTPNITIVAAFAENRRKAFELGSNVVVTNHDAATWLAKNPDVLEGFKWLVVDESTAYKHRTTQRSKAVKKIADQFGRRVMMTGTPMANHVTDIWHQVFLADDGEHLGGKFFAFRNTVCVPVPVTHQIMDWKERDGAREVIADMIAPISIRYKLEDCTDIPEQHHYDKKIELSKKLRKQYNEMLQTALLQLEKGEVEAVNAAVLVNKLMQIASGAVYSPDGAFTLDPDRADLVAQLCEERDHTLVAFQWKHQRDALIDALGRAGIKKDQIGVIDGETKDAFEVVESFQDGQLRVVLAQPQSAAHGLTLTKAKTIIWASPTWNAETYDQFNRRIYRTGQDEKTEVIHIVGENTADERVYAGLRSKLEGQLSLLSILTDLTRMKEAA